MARERNVVRGGFEHPILLTPGADRTGRHPGSQSGPQALSGAATVGLDLPARPPGLLPSHLPLLPNGAPDLIALSAMGYARTVEKYRKRLASVAALRARCADHKYPKALTITAVEFNVEPRSLRRWDDKARKKGWLGLLGKYGGNRGRSRLTEGDKQALLDGMLSGAAPYDSQLHKLVTVRRFLERGEEPPAEDTTTRFCSKYRKQNPGIVAFAQRGPRYWQGHFQARCQRDLSTLRVNEVWSLDSTWADNFVWLPDGRGRGHGPFGKLPCPCGCGRERRRCGSVIRPRLSFAFDIASGYIVAVEVAEEENQVVHARLILHGAAECGLPERIQTDRGLAYKAARLWGQPAGKPKGKSECLPTPFAADVEAGLTAIGIVHLMAKPLNAPAKYAETGINRWTREVARFLPCHSGNSSLSKPEGTERQKERGEYPTWEEFCGAVERARIELNKLPVGERDRAPIAFYEGFQKRTVPPELLAFLLQGRRKLRVRMDGLVVDKYWFFSEELTDFIGQDVEVRFDQPGDAQIFVYTASTRTLLVPLVERATYDGWGPTNELVARGVKRQKRQLREAAKVKGASGMLLDRYGLQAEVQKRLASVAARVKEQEQLLLSAAEGKTEEASATRRPPSIYAQIERDARRAAECRPPARDVLAVVAWERAEAHQAKADTRTLAAVDVWLRAVLAQPAGWRAAHAKDVDLALLADLEDLLPHGNTLKDEAGAAALRVGSAAAIGVGHLLGSLYNLGHADLGKTAWERAAPAVLRDADQLAAGFERDGLAGANEDDLRALGQLGLVELAGLTLAEALAGAAGADRRGVPASEWKGGADEHLAQTS